MKLTARQRKEHFDHVAKCGCLVCGDAATIHHVTGHADRIGRFSRSDRLVTPLCPMHHQAVFDPYAIAHVPPDESGGDYQPHGF